MFIIDQEKITLSELKDHNNYIRLHDLALSYDLANEVQGSRDLYDKLLVLLKGAESNFVQELLSKYKKLLVLLQFISLPSQTDEVINKLFKENLVMAIYHGVDVKGKIELYMLFFSTNDLAERLSKTILKSLSENSERIGKRPLVIKGESKPLEPLVKNWLKDYINFSVNYKVRDDLSLSIYMNQSKNIKQLSKKEIEVIATIIKIHNFLSFPSAEKREVKATGHIPRTIPRTLKTEEIDKIGNLIKPVAGENQTMEKKPSPQVISQPAQAGLPTPRLRQVGEAGKALAELKQLAASYPPGSLERKAVEEEISRATRNS